jgi:hypothetical protein
MDSMDSMDGIAAPARTREKLKALVKGRSAVEDGLSTRDIEALFADLEGRTLLSRTPVNEVTERLRVEYEAFASRDFRSLRSPIFCRWDCRTAASGTSARGRCCRLGASYGRSDRARDHRGGDPCAKAAARRSGPRRRPDLVFDRLKGLRKTTSRRGV